MISKSSVLLLSILLSLDWRNLIFLLCPHREMTLYHSTFKNFESSYRLWNETTKKEGLCNLISQKSRKLHPWYNLGKTAFENTLTITVPQDLQEVEVSPTVAFTIIFLVHHRRQWLHEAQSATNTSSDTIGSQRISNDFCPYCTIVYYYTLIQCVQRQTPAQIHSSRHVLA